MRSFEKFGQYARSKQSSAVPSPEISCQINQTHITHFGGSGTDFLTYTLLTLRRAKCLIDSQMMGRNNEFVQPGRHKTKHGLGGCYEIVSVFMGRFFCCLKGEACFWHFAKIMSGILIEQHFSPIKRHFCNFWTLRQINILY